MADENLGYPGVQSPGYGSDGWGAVAFIARQIMNRICTTTLCKVVKVTNAGELSEAGFIDVQPLVNQVDSTGKPIPHGVIYNVPYIRLQGGANAIIIDPAVGDIGYVGFASHDISGVIAARGQANPASFRRYDLSDAVWIGGILNGVPTQYVRFSADGIEVKSPTLVKVTAPEIHLDAAALVSADTPLLRTTGNVQVGNGASGTVPTGTGNVLTFQDGICTNIY